MPYWITNSIYPPVGQTIRSAVALLRSRAGRVCHLAQRDLPELGRCERTAVLPASWRWGGGSATQHPWLEADGHAYVLAIASKDSVDPSWQSADCYASMRAVTDRAVSPQSRLSASYDAMGPCDTLVGLVTLAPQNDQAAAAHPSPPPPG